MLSLIAEFKNFGYKIETDRASYIRGYDKDGELQMSVIVNGHGQYIDNGKFDGAAKAWTRYEPKNQKGEWCYCHEKGLHIID